MMLKQEAVRKVLLINADMLGLKVSPRSQQLSSYR